MALKALVIYDSQFGNTERIAWAIRDALSAKAETRLVRASNVAPRDLSAVDVLIVGSPTQRFHATEPIDRLLKGVSSVSYTHLGAIGALAALILLSTTFAYILYFFLLKNVGPTRTASVTFLVPVFGSLWAVLFLREPFSVWMLLGMAIILTSVGLVTSRRADQGRPLPAGQLPDTTPP